MLSGLKVGVCNLWNQQGEELPNKVGASLQPCFIPQLYSNSFDHSPSTIKRALTSVYRSLMSFINRGGQPIFPKIEKRNWRLTVSEALVESIKVIYKSRCCSLLFSIWKFHRSYHFIHDSPVGNQGKLYVKVNQSLQNHIDKKLSDNTYLNSFLTGLYQAIFWGEKGFSNHPYATLNISRKESATCLKFSPFFSKI